MIEIDFFGGLHGNFLCYVVNSLNDDTKKFSPFTKYGSSHAPYEKTLAVASHYTVFNKPFLGQEIISITANKEDCLLVSLLCYGRGGDFNLDLKNFNINFYDQVKNTAFFGDIKLINQAYNVKLEETNSVARGILREYYKFNFKNYSANSLMVEISKQRYKFDVLSINFKQLYTFDSFIDTIDQIIAYFKLSYTVNIDFYHNLWQKFIDQNLPIKQNAQSFAVLDAIINNKYMEIDFNLLQESWLNARLERLYNKEMPFHQDEYFKNTKEIIKYLNKVTIE